MKRTIAVVLLFSTILTTGFAQKKKSGEEYSAQAKKGVIPAWEKGYLDIHFISTNTGESTFIIMPDGTQMLVDMAGVPHGPDNSMYMPWMPDESRMPGEWINRYIARCMAWTGNDVLDYVSVTHFHGDHIGADSPRVQKSANGDYKLISFAEVMDGNKVGMLVDRGWPDYDYPKPLRASKTLRHYFNCVDYHVSNGLKVEKFRPGYDDQFVMKYDPASYPDFKIMNIAVNGEVWTGEGHQVHCAFPDKSTFTGSGAAKDPSPSENAVSSVFKLSYGDFDYYAGGDVTHNGMSYFEWKNVEKPVADAVGQVEVMKSNHHGSSDSNNQYFVDKLSPQAVIVNVWRNVQPRGGVAKYLQPEVNEGQADIFTTSLDLKLEEKFGHAAARILSKEGHVLVRVNPGGASYYIYSLRNTDETMRINERFGPYMSR